MIWWILALAVVTILSYLADTGVWTLLSDIRMPVLNASLLSLLLLLVTLGILVRMLYLRGKGEKEKLLSRVQELEKKG